MTTTNNPINVGAPISYRCVADNLGDANRAFDIKATFSVEGGKVNSFDNGEIRVTGESNIVAWPSGYQIPGNLTINFEAGTTDRKAILDAVEVFLAQVKLRIESAD